MRRVGTLLRNGFAKFARRGASIVESSEEVTMLSRLDPITLSQLIFLDAESATVCLCIQD